MTDAARLAEKLGDVRLQTHAQIELTQFRAFSEPEGKSEELRRVAEEAIPVFTALDDEEGLVAAWFAIAVAEMTWGQSGAQQEAIEQAMLHARRCGDPWLERQAAWGLGIVLVYGPTHVRDGLRRCSELREQLPGSILFDASCLAAEAVLEAMSGNFETARRHVAHIRAVVAEFGFEGFVPGELFWSVEMLAGDPVAAERAVRPEYERLTASGEKGICAGRATFLAEALYEQGRDEEAESFIETARELAASDDVAVHELSQQTLAKILTRRGALAEAEQLARDAVELCAKTDWSSDHANALMCLAHVLDTAGRRAEALPLLTEALGLYDQKGNVVGSGRARRQLASLQATPTG